MISVEAKRLGTITGLIFKALESKIRYSISSEAPRHATLPKGSFDGELNEDHRTQKTRISPTNPRDLAVGNESEFNTIVMPAERIELWYTKIREWNIIEALLGRDIYSSKFRASLGDRS